MPRSSPKKDPVIEFINSCFPGESDPKQVFKGMLESVTEDHELFLDAVIGWLNTLVENLKKSVNRPSRRRFICKLDTSNKKKHWYSVADKLWRESTKSDPKYDLHNFHEIMTDLVRLRVVCNFLSDIESFESALSEDYGSDILKQKAFYIEKTDDSTKQRPKDRKSGHRSIKYLFTSKDFPGVLLELQIMTLFQEAWDQKDHYLIYERRRQQPERDSENFPGYEDELVHDMGGSLNVLDTLFNQIKHKLENNHHEDP